MLPHEFTLLAKHVLGSATFTENLLYWQEASYFDISSEVKPLLHLWSLSIEEQFYIIWPILLYSLLKKGISLPKTIAAIIILSFIGNVLWAQYHATTVYFSLFTRMWEFALGGIGAVYFDKISLLRKNNFFTNLISCVGIFCIIISLYTIESSMLFPYYWGLLPTIGAMLLIVFTRNSWFNRVILSNQALKFIGLISYPLYLWHWPLIAFANILNPLGVSITCKMFLVTLSFILAVLTYYFIENPIRLGISNNKKIYGLLIAMLFVIIISILSFIKIIVPYNKIDINHIQTDWNGPNSIESFQFENKAFNIIKTNVSNQTVFYSDSNSLQYIPRLRYLAEHNPEQMNTAVLITEDGCAPMVGVDRDKAPQCFGLPETFLNYVKSNANVRNVVFSSAWSQHQLGFRAYYYRKINTTQKYYLRDNYDLALESLKSMIIELHNLGKKIFIVLNIPIDPRLSPENIYRKNIWDPYIKSYGSITGIAKKDFLQVSRSYNAKLRKISQETGAIVIDPAQHLCDETTCHAIRDGYPIYLDSSYYCGHLNATFAKKFADFIDGTVLD